MSVNEIPIRIDELNPVAGSVAGYLMPAMKDGVAASVTVEEIVDETRLTYDPILAGMNPATRGALAALPGGLVSSARLTEKGREGTFVLRAGNFTADVAADTQQGLFVAPASDPTGATKVWARPADLYIDAAWFDLIGDGSTYNTVALGKAMVAASRYGKELRFREGKFKTGAAVSPGLNGNLKMRGAGHGGDKATGYNGSGVISALIPTMRGTIFLPDASHSFLDVATNSNIDISELQISYLAGAAAGTYAIKISAGNDAVGPKINGNTHSRIRNIMTTGANRAIGMFDALQYHITDNHLLYNGLGGIVVDNELWRSYQISWVSRNAIWGGTGNFIEMRAGGELRINDNKLQGGGPSSIGIMHAGAPNGSGSANMEPIFITNNSMEGQNYAIVWNTDNPLQASSQIVVTGNQMWMGTGILVINEGAQPGYPWLGALTWGKNICVINGGSGVGPIMAIGGLAEANFSGDTFFLTSGTGTTWSFGNNNVLSRIKRTGNHYGFGLTYPQVIGGTPAVPASTVTLLNASASDVMVHVSGGTVTAIKIDGATVATTTDRSVYLPLGRTISITYSAAPSWIWQIVNP